MEPDRELEGWQRQWQARDAVPADLRRRVEREIQRRRWGLGAAIAVTIGFGGGIPAWAVVSRRADVAVLAAAVWVFIVAAWVVSSALDRGLSPPRVMTTAAFLDYSIRATVRRRRGVAAAAVLYLAITAFNLAWIYQTRSAWPDPLAFAASPALVVLYVVTACLAALGLVIRHRLGRQLRNLGEMRQRLDGDGAPAGQAEPTP